MLHSQSPIITFSDAMLEKQPLWTGETPCNFFFLLSLKELSTSCVFSDKFCKDMATGDWLNNPLQPLSPPSSSLHPTSWANLHISFHWTVDYRWKRSFQVYLHTLSLLVHSFPFTCHFVLVFFSFSSQSGFCEFTHRVMTCYWLMYALCILSDLSLL